MADILYHDHIGVRVTDQAQTFSGAKRFNNEINAYNSYPTARNMIINSQMGQWQRGTGFTPLSGVITYTSDRFAVYSNTVTLVAAQSVQRPIEQTAYSLNLDTSVVGDYSTASKVTYIRYLLEKRDVRELAGRPIILSFYVRSSLPGTYSVRLLSPYGVYYHIYITTYNIIQANTWERKTVSLTLPTTAVSGNTGQEYDRGLYINWTLGCSSDFQTTTLNTWFSSSVLNDNYASTNQVDWGTDTAHDFYLTGVMLHAGSDVAADFVPFGQNYHEEETACGRYYKYIPVSSSAFAGGFVMLAYGDANNVKGVSLPSWDMRGLSWKWRFLGATFTVRSAAGALHGTMESLPFTKTMTTATLVIASTDLTGHVAFVPGVLYHLVHDTGGYITISTEFDE
jgi:hypothetical protein